MSNISHSAEREMSRAPSQGFERTVYLAKFASLTIIIRPPEINC